MSGPCTVNLGAVPAGRPWRSSSTTEGAVTASGGSPGDRGMSSTQPPWFGHEWWSPVLRCRAGGRMTPGTPKSCGSTRRTRPPDLSAARSDESWDRAAGTVHRGHDQLEARWQAPRADSATMRCSAQPPVALLATAALDAKRRANEPGARRDGDRRPKRRRHRSTTSPPSAPTAGSRARSTRSRPVTGSWPSRSASSASSATIAAGASPRSSPTTASSRCSRRCWR